MLTHLVIKNYALIKHLELMPSPRLNVITGETGAGKSIMLGAMGLLLGNRADAKTLWNENEKCITEGVFNIAAYKLQPLFEEEDLDYQDTTTLRREISPGGKSRAFINDTPVTLDVMRKIGGKLMDIHSQHETLELAGKAFQLSLVDTFAGNGHLKKEYQTRWKAYTEAQKNYEALMAEAEALKNESDFISFQLDELTRAQLTEGELEQLESDLKIMEHAEEIKTGFNRIIQQMSGTEYSVSGLLASIRAQLQSIVQFAPAYESLLQRFESARIELNDILQEWEAAEEKTEVNPHLLEKTKERLNLLYHLLQKHRARDVSGLISLRNSLSEKHAKIINIDHLVDNARKALAASETEMIKAGEALSQARQKIFNPLARHLISLLRELGMPDAQLSFQHTKSTPAASGIDSIEILFSANKGVGPLPLAQVASGGEFSRLMFSIKYVMAEKTALPTLILDEIDTGVSGEIAIRLGNRMKEMAIRHQVISISHLPQIASKADVHFYVFKENTTSRTMTSVKLLSPEERISEIAQMIGGARPSAKAIENAREMLNTSV
jgi:DNA repair protein RecN (Recombination protein N)